MPKIPTACITVEDAEMMSRMASRGNKIVVHLEMGAKTYPDADSYNTVAEITGSKYPEQVSEGGRVHSGRGHSGQVAILRIVRRREHESVETVLVDSLKPEASYILPIKMFTTLKNGRQTQGQNRTHSVESQSKRKRKLCVFPLELEILPTIDTGLIL